MEILVCSFAGSLLRSFGETKPVRRVAHPTHCGVGRDRGGPGAPLVGELKRSLIRLTPLLVNSNSCRSPSRGFSTPGVSSETQGRVIFKFISSCPLFVRILLPPHPLLP